MLYNGFVYLAKSDTGHYKIGRSKNPYGRIKHFDTIMPVKVEIIHYFPCDDPALIERTLHGMLALHKAAGEWFNLPYETVQAICNITHVLNSYLYGIMGYVPGKKYLVHNCCDDHTKYMLEKLEDWIHNPEIREQMKREIPTNGPDEMVQALFRATT